MGGLIGDKGRLREPPGSKAFLSKETPYHATTTAYLSSALAIQAAWQRA